MKHLLSTIPDYEDEKTLKLFKKYAALNSQGYLTKKQLVEILTWKSQRPLKHYEKNSDKFVREITTLAFATKSDIVKIHILTALMGVNYPSASAILMFYDKGKYPILDIRVWQQLHMAKLVVENAKGQNFTLLQWEKYLRIIRTLAKDLNLTARQVEKRLYDYDKKTRLTQLYSGSTSTK